MSSASGGACRLAAVTFSRVHVSDATYDARPASGSVVCCISSQRHIVLQESNSASLAGSSRKDVRHCYRHCYSIKRHNHNFWTVNNIVRVTTSYASPHSLARPRCCTMYAFCLVRKICFQSALGPCPCHLSSSLHPSPEKICSRFMTYCWLTDIQPSSIHNNAQKHNFGHISCFNART